MAAVEKFTAEKFEAVDTGHTQAKGFDTQLKDIDKKLPLRVLSPQDWQHWITRGYVVIPNAVPRANVERLVALLWRFQEMDPNDTATWSRPQLRDHKMKELNNSGMVEIYNHQYLWDNRQEKRLYDAFVDIWDREDLWVSVDRANLNTPNRDARGFNGFIHWDVDTSVSPLPIGVQGVLSLVDTDSQTGGFQCVPSLFATLEEWRKTQPADRNPRAPDPETLAREGHEIVNVPMKAGDMLIFNSLLAHGIRPNRSEDRVRMAQYISMAPANEADAIEREERIACWRDQQPPQRGAFPGDPREWEKHNASRAVLTPLGEKLLGLRSWQG
jgi:hypothetical protein